MSKAASEKTAYDQLLNEKLREADFDNEDGSPRPQRQGWSPGLIAWCLLAIGWVILLPIAISNRRPGVIDTFDDPMGAPIEYVKQRYTGLVDAGDFRPFDDPFDPSTEDYWNTMLDVGIVKLSPDEAERLPSETGPVFGEEPFYAGNIEVFHQLHCLNRIRRMYYFPEENEYNETATSRKGHAKHCFGYLEQTLRCHSDVGVMSVHYNPTTKGYRPTWNIVKSCRNFDLIHDWARSRKIAHAERETGEGQLEE